MNLEKIAYPALGMLEFQDRNRDATGLEYSTWVKEFRTVTIGVPRQAGKTRLLIETANKLRSLVLVPQLSMVRQLQAAVKRSPVVSLGSAEMQRQIKPADSSPFFDCILIDEFRLIGSHQWLVYDPLLTWMYSTGIVDENLMVVQLGT